MPSYRFAFHAENEQLIGEERQSCANDDAAIRFARALLGHHVIVMVWLGDRFVKRVTRSS